MRVLAMYLPQFHRIPENDAWWGEGFTEWTAVKNAKPLYEGHDQPRVPLNDNYYDLLDKKTMEWQASLMHEYGIDGMCMYHYWFRDGKRLLEKPAENLLKWTDIDMPFCFCWANESWVRSWSKLSRGGKNAWADLYDPSAEDELSDDRSGVLTEQAYGDESDWIDHFKYMMPFLEDSRYIKVEGKPLILIYNVTDIPCFREMSACWRKLAIEHGLNGLYIIGGGLDKDYSDCLDGIYYRSPTDLKDLYRNYPDSVGTAKPIPYEAVWDSVMDMVPIYKAQPYFMGLTGFDTTPRKGEHGIIYERGEAGYFGRMLKNLFLKNQLYGSDLTFINAWNEWGEGMYLEPDNTTGYSFLEALREAKKKLGSYDDHDTALDKEFEIIRSKYEREYASRNRAEINVDIMDRWMRLSEKGIDLSEYISSNYPKSIAVYGYGVLGRRLCRMLCKNNCNLRFIVDKNPNVSIDEIIVNHGCSLVHDISDMQVVDCCIIALSSGYEEAAYEFRKLGKARSITTIKELIDRADS